MKKPIAIALAFVLVTALACRRETPDSDMVAASDTTATDTSGTMSSTSTASTGGSVSTASPADKEFVAQAGEAGLAEVRQSELAQQRAQNAEVKAFAQRMIADHGKGNEELQQLATTKGLVVPTALNEQHQAAVSHLQGLNGRAFDRMYVQHMAEDHQKVVSMFEAAERTAQDPDLRNWITKTLPTLREHLKHVQSLQAKVK